MNEVKKNKCDKRRKIVMTQEEKQLLLKDLCGRIPYGVICHYNCVIPIEGREFHKANCKDVLKGIIPTSDGHIGFMVGFDRVNALEGDIKPYLRPMSSMTEEEKKDLKKHTCPDGTGTFDEKYLICPVNHYGEYISYEFMSDILAWLNEHHFDYHNLIEKGLALEITENNNPY